MEPQGSIATHYQLDLAQPAPLIIGGLRAFAAQDRREPARRLLALQSAPDLPPRARVLARAIQSTPVPNLVLPLDQGPGRDPAGRPAFFLLCPAMPGPALGADRRPWPEAEAMRCLLRPAVLALEALAERSMTHRAIRPDNMFRAGPGEPVTLGPFWATPPASLQPAALEPPYSAQCLPAGRGEGTIADDIYALGVTLLWCLLGGPPAWDDAPAILRRKIDVGSLAALAPGANISSGMHDTLMGMLADDPDHRPNPNRLLAPEQARNRRLATRPAPRAQRPLTVGAQQAWTARELAHAIALEPEQGVTVLNSGTADRWIRRLLGDGQLAVNLEAATSQEGITETDPSRQNASTMMRAICALDPLAPLVWRGVAVFPDGIGTALAAAQGANNGANSAVSKATVSAALEEIVVHDVAIAWAAQQPRRRDLGALRQDTRDWRGWIMQRGPMGGVKRLLYGANPLLACGSALLGGQVAARLQDLLPALEEAAPRADRAHPPIDAHIAAFIAARADGALLNDIGQLDGFATTEDRLAVIALFSRLQSRLHPAPLPGLAGWLLESGLIDVAAWRNLAQRKLLAERLAEAARAGQIAGMQRLANDTAARAADAAAAEKAAARVAAITVELATLETEAAARATEAERLGHEIATGAGLLAVVGAAVALGLAI
jgi:eukaryotic-like serine/threonine-protein kinase